MFQRACRLEIEIRTLFTSGILGLHFRCKNVGTLVDASSTDLQFYVLWPCHSLRDTYSPGWYPVPFLFPFVSFDIVLFHNVAPEAKLCLSDRQSLIMILQSKVRVTWSLICEPHHPWVHMSVTMSGGKLHQRIPVWKAYTYFSKWSFWLFTSCQLRQRHISKVMGIVRSTQTSHN